MPRKRQEAEAANHERWLISYADFITLLFAFFVVMFAAGQTDKSKAKEVSDSVKEALEKGNFSRSVFSILGGTLDDKGKGLTQKLGPGGLRSPKKQDEVKETVAELLPSLKRLTDDLQREIAAGKVHLSLEGRGLVVSLKEATFFPSGGDTLEPATFESLGKIADVIKTLPNPVRLEGHTDSIPIANTRFRDNWDLSAARAISTLNLFTRRFGVAPSRLAVAGYADTAPVSPNDDAAGRARNRRVDILILNQQGMVAEPGKAPKAAAVTVAKK
ncbi:MAG TPA: flagellar motor protein MotB [Bryobacteraceae bacterium]|nr:flagellar motor protein MotB [Bryobacteraceae bacterium]